MEFEGRGIGVMGRGGAGLLIGEHRGNCSGNIEETAMFCIYQCQLLHRLPMLCIAARVIVLPMVNRKREWRHCLNCRRAGNNLT